MYLGLDLPSQPLFIDEMSSNQIPQVPLSTLLEKYGNIPTMIEETEWQYKILKLPKYLILHYKRFSKHHFSGNEKNPTIVSFDLIHDFGVVLVGDSRKYRLVANILHDDAKEATKGSYKIQLCRDGQWYLLKDLIVEEMITEMVSLTESYIQIWKRID